MKMPYGWRLAGWVGLSTAACIVAGNLSFRTATAQIAVVDDPKTALVLPRENGVPPIVAMAAVNQAEANAQVVRLLTQIRDELVRQGKIPVDCAP